MSEPADLLISARWIIPVEPHGATLSSHSVAVRDGKIIALGPTRELSARFDATETCDLDRHVLLPGLVNTHTHAAMTLFRGLADDLPLMRWLREHIWPGEAKHVSDAFVHDGTLLACAEMLRGGITTVNDMYFFPGAAARAILQSGMRGALGIIAIEFPTVYASDPDDYLAKGFSVRDQFRGEPLLSFCLAPHAPYTVSDGTLSRIGTLADELDIPVHIHLHETRDELETSVRDHGVRPIARLKRLGLLGPRLLAVHAVHVSTEEVGELSAAGASIAHCPTSNLKLACGIAPIPAFNAAGITVSLGTDGAASNNQLDIFQEMRLAALLAKGGSLDASAFPAHETIRAATLSGARALGLDRTIGSIEIGKSADFCAVSLESLECVPCYDPASHLAYVAGRNQVTDVWVAGRRLLNCRNLTTLDADSLNNLGQMWQNKIAVETST